MRKKIKETKGFSLVVVVVFVVVLDEENKSVLHIIQVVSEISL